MTACNVNAFFLVKDRAKEERILPLEVLAYSFWACFLLAFNICHFVYF